METESDRRQLNLRLNETAETQLEQLAQRYNLSKTAVIKMAVSELYEKRFGKRMDHDERLRKKEARSVKEKSTKAQDLHGLKGKLFAKQ